MICQRCKAQHKPDNQLVSTEQGLLCPACMRVVEATKQYRYGHPVFLVDDKGPIIDPLFNPYEQAQTYAPQRNYMQEALEQTMREWPRPIVDAEKPVGISEMTMNILANYGLKEHLQRCLDEAGKRAVRQVAVQWDEDDNG